MCDPQRTRREFVAGALGATAVGLAGYNASEVFAGPEPFKGSTRRASTIQVAEGLQIHPRADWGADLPPKRVMGAEDVRSSHVAPIAIRLAPRF